MKITSAWQHTYPSEDLVGKNVLLNNNVVGKVSSITEYGLITMDIFDNNAIKLLSKNERNYGNNLSDSGIEIDFTITDEKLKTLNEVVDYED